MGIRFRRTKQHDLVSVDHEPTVRNRRQLDADLAAGLDTSDLATATLMVEVDGLASSDDTIGEFAADQLVERVSWVIMATVRTTDVVYRHSRFCFCVLLPATSNSDALSVADRIRVNVQKMQQVDGPPTTVSIGVATGAGNEVATTIERAETALSSGAGTGSNEVLRLRST